MDAHYSHYSSRPRVAELSGRAWRALNTWWLQFQTWRDHKRAVAALEAMEDHMLKDIGLDRSEITSVVTKGRVRGHHL